MRGFMGESSECMGEWLVMRVRRKAAKTMAKTAIGQNTAAAVATAVLASLPRTVGLLDLLAMPAAAIVRSWRLSVS